SFIGRATERDILVRAICREALVVLYGQSGLGKTSLIQAGVFPHLRRAGGFPISIRLNFDKHADSLTRQVLKEIKRSAEIAVQLYPQNPELHIKIPPIPDEVNAPALTLWEYFHTRDQYFWTASNELATPVLVFDQFEEWFTRGESFPLQQRQAFLKEIRQLLDNDPPPGHDTDKGWNLERVPLAIVLSLREDYLAHLNGLREFLPGLGVCGFRLLPLTEVQARRVIEEPAPWPADEKFTASVLELLRISKRETLPLPMSSPTMASLSSEIDYDPAILSLLLSRLFPLLIKNNAAEERAGVVRDQGPNVLPDFCIESVRKA